MLRLTLVLSVLLAAGCQPRPAPGVPPSAGVAVAQPAAPTGDAVLDAFLADLAAAIDGQDWDDVQAMIAPEGYGEAVAAARAGGAARLDAEARATGAALGLGDFAASRAALDRVRVVTLRTVFAMNDMPDITHRVEGDVRLDDGSTLPMAVGLARTGDGYRIEMPPRRNAR